MIWYHPTPLLYCSFRPALFSNMGIPTRVSVSQQQQRATNSTPTTPLVLYYDRTTAASLLKQQLNRPLAFWKSGNLYSDMLKSTSKIASAGQSIEPKRLLLLRLVFNFFKNLSFQLTFIQLCNPYYWILIGDVQLWFNQVPFCTPEGVTRANF